MTNSPLIRLAIDIAGGSQSALARKLGVSPQAVHAWLKGGAIHYLNAIAIERATNGQVSRSDLRPDIWPPQEPQDRGVA